MSQKGQDQSSAASAQTRTKLPVVAIVGRPNVGKSSLLNCLARRRISIVEETPGVTRDRVATTIEHQDVTMEVVDTGGIGVIDSDDLSDHVERQIDFAVRDANAILFVTDAKDGIVPLDREVARRLRERSHEIPVFVVANKVDAPRYESDAQEFFALGLGEPIPVSAKARLGTDALLDAVVEKLWPTGDVNVEPVMRLAVVGRQNVGKSSLVNAVAREERVIVSEVPGTTRDAVDVLFRKDDREFVVIDTAGVKRKRRTGDSIEFYSRVRTESAVRRADVVLFLLDASQEVTRADKRLADLIVSTARTCIIVANKWDLVKEAMTTEQYADYLYRILPGLRFAPVVSTTATQSRNLQSMLDLAQNLFKRASRRVTTGELNRVVEAIKEYHPPRVRGSRVPKIYYSTQVATSPPTFILFVNDPHLFPADYRRYVENALREALDFEELAVRVIYRPRERDEKR